MLFLNASDVRRALSVRECIDVMSDLYEDEAADVFAQPPRTVIRIDSSSVILTMPAYSPKLRRFATKIVTEYKENPLRNGGPIQGGVTVLMDSSDSKVLAILDSPEVTAIRTGAVSGLATKFLSRPDSEAVASIGSGQQARSMFRAVAAVRNIKKGYVYSRNPENASLFASELSRDLGFEIRKCSARDEALKNADIVNLATNSATPVVKRSEIADGAHINSVGTLPDRQELDIQTIIDSALFVDTKEGVLREAGDIISAIKHGRISEKSIRGDLSQLARGIVKGREENVQITLFKSVGFALQDVYASSFVYTKLAKE